MRLARERGVTVLLDGQGADEQLGGYLPYVLFLEDLVRAARSAGRGERRATSRRRPAGAPPR